MNINILMGVENMSYFSEYRQHAHLPSKCSSGPNLYYNAKADWNFDENGASPHHNL